MTTHVETLRGMLEEYDYDGFALERAALEAAIAALNDLPALLADARIHGMRAAIVAARELIEGGDE